jgi:uncharacterized repeat protein (TIGR03803 family)
MRKARIAFLSSTALGVALLAGLSFAATDAAATFQVIHDFTGGKDGAVPGYTLTKDGNGRFLGAAHDGGAGYGTIFELRRKNDSWAVKALYDFSGDDGQPGWGVVRANGQLYANAGYASVMGGPCGSALDISKPHGAPAAKWTSVVMRTYVKSQDGCPTGNLLVDASGNVFGVTQNGGANNWGSVFELSPNGSGWTETILHAFTGGPDDGGAPYSGLIEDGAGNLYGTATACASGCWGTVFELTPSEEGWVYKVLYAFKGGADGGQPTAGLLMDKEGNLFGAAESAGPTRGGTIFELSPSDGSWHYQVLASMSGTGGPVAALAMDKTGNLYGTNFFDGADSYGSVFKVKHTAKGWRYQTLHDFTGGADGGYPGGGVVLDKDGSLYGTAVIGGANSLGVIYQITQ